MMRKVLLAGSFAVLTAAAASAQTPALVTQSSPYIYNGGPWTLGWQFSVNSSITVTNLGVFDADLDGFAESHDVGLWDMSGNLLGSGTLAAGASGTLINNFRYVSVTPFVLTAGNSYRVGAEMGNADGWAFGNGTPTTISEISYTQASWCYGGSLQNPDCGYDDFSEGYFGGTFATDGEVAPEPASLVLFGTGIIGVAGFTRRRRKA